MAKEKYFPFRSISGDRKYSAEDWAAYFAQFIGNGVFYSSADKLKVEEYNGMKVKVQKGAGFIGGRMYLLEEDLTIKLDTADGVVDRVDRIVLRCDYNNRLMTVTVKKGGYGANPTAPELTRDTGVYELALADVYVAAGAVTITAANITDQRFNTSLCGIVTGLIEQADTEEIFSQFQAAFTEWFEYVKEVLSEDAAGNLLALINTKASNADLQKEVTERKNEVAVERARIDALTKMEEGSTTGDVELQDIRIGVDGVTYETAGAAVRAQASALAAKIEEEASTLSSEIANNENIIKFCFDNIDKKPQQIKDFNPIIGGLASTNGSINTATNRVTTEEIMVIDDTLPLFLETDSNITANMIAWYKADGTFIKLASFSNGVIPMSAYCRLVFKRLDDSDMSLNDVSSAFVYQTRDSIPAMNVRSKNKFDITNVYNGFINMSNGQLKESDSYISSHLIDVREFEKGIAINTQYRKFLAYDENQTAITDSYIDAWTEANVIPLDSSWSYIRVTFSSTATNIQIEDNTEITDYEKFGYVLNEDTMNEILSKVGKDNLVGLVGMSFGDSIMYGAGGGSVGILDILAEKHGVISHDYSVSGASMQYVSSRPHIIAQIQNAITNGITPNFILLDGLSNDILSSTLGELTDSFDFETKGYATFTDGMEYAIGLLKGAFPSVPIIYVIPHSTPARVYETELQFGERAREICRKWSVQIADVYKNGNLNTRLQNQLELYSYYPTETSGTHPNRNGYDFAYIPLVEDILRRLF